MTFKALKQSLEDARRAHLYVEAVIKAVRHPMGVLDKDLRVAFCSTAYHGVFQV